MYLYPNRRPKFYRASLDNTKLTLGRVNVFYRIKDVGASAIPGDTSTVSNKLVFRQLSASTNYLRVPDFSYEIHGAIDSIVQTNIKALTSKPNLIIDVRNNGGGADRSYAALLPVMMNDTLNPSPITAAIYCTPDIIEDNIKHKYEHCETKADSAGDDSTIAYIQRYKGQYTPAEFDTFSVDTVYHYPLKIAVVMNKWCASSAEGFILTARQSSKVKLYGENTSGMLGYGDWRAVKMPHLPIEISMPTKKMFFRNNEDYESTGIPPDIQLDPEAENDWVKQVQAHIEK